MSAVAAPSQQSQPAPSLNTPGFFSQAFLELNVFEQCFSSLQAESSTPSTSSASSTSEQKMNNPTGNPNPPPPKSIGRQNGGNEYSTPLGPALSLPSPIMHERKLYPIQQQHQNSMMPSPMYQTVDRRYSLQEPLFGSSSMQSQPSLAIYHANRRFSHQQPLTSTFSVPPCASPWVGSTVGHGEAPFNGDQRQPTASPRLQQYYLAHPTPPNSTHSNSPIDKFNIDEHPQSQLSPVDNLSPLDTLINDSTEEIHGQATPPAEDSSFFDGSGSDGTSIHNGPEFQTLSGLQAPPQLAPPETPRTNTRARRGSAKAGPSNTRKSKKSNVEPPPVEAENEVHDAKRKRFLERNRVAASKCRQKKKMWMQDLELNARNAQSNSKHLTNMVGCLREEVLQLKGMLLKHSGCSCSQVATYLLNEAAKVANGAKQSMESMENAKNCTNQATTSFHSQLRYSSSSSSINEDENPFEDDDMLDEGMPDFENELELRDPRGQGSP